MEGLTFYPLAFLTMREASHGLSKRGSHIMGVSYFQCVYIRSYFYCLFFFAFGLLYALVEVS